jgi:predicted ATPase/class 3 adenylate cyclase
MPELPVGTLTFLFTDVEGSTRLWEQHPVQMRQVMARHDELVESLIIQHNGVIVRPRGEGDSRFAVFQLATDSVIAAGEFQRHFAEEQWTIPSALRLRIGLHTGEADLRDGDYYGAAVNRCARLRSVAHGGQTLLSQTTYELVRDSLLDYLSLRDLGEHHLKDLNHPERIYQLIYLGLPSDFPPLLTHNQFLTNLPIALTSFVGRENELAYVKGLFATRRLLTISGPGGAGKTRLAVQVAEGLLDNFTDGAWFVDLSTLSNPVHLTNYVLNSLGIREEVNTSPVKTLVDFLRDKLLLLLLDNCEHILQGIAPLVKTLLQSSSNLKILATSRSPLGITGEMVWVIPPLSTPRPNGEIPIEMLLKYESVRLFVDRATAARADFAITRTNATAVAQICARLDGIPLAIELAAVRVRALSVSDIAARLDDRFRLLVSKQNAVHRQKTLRNLIDWSHDLLPQNERAMFRRLSVFTGGWTLEMAEQVCSGDYYESSEVLDLLANLVDKSLVMVDCTEGSERYYFLETIRQYAQTRLAESQEVEGFSCRHAHAFAKIAEHAFGELWGPRQGFWLARLDMEQENLRSAIEWMAQRNDGDDRLLSMTVSLWRFWEIRGYLREGLSRLEFALEHTPNASTSLRANGLRGAGMLSIQQGDYDRASAMHEQSLVLFRDIEDKLGIGRELEVLGEIAQYQGDYARSVELYTESLALRHEIEDKEGVAKSLGHLGIIARDRGQYHYARELLEESLSLSRELEDRLMAASALKNLGVVAFNLCEYLRASKLFEEALSLYREMNDRLGISETLQNLGSVAKDRGDFQRATAFYLECLELKQEMGDKRGIAQTISSQAEVNFHQGNYSQAADSAEQGLVLFRELRVKRGVIYCLGLQAFIAHYQGDYLRAQSLAGEILARAGEIGAPRPVAYAKEVLGLGAYARRDLDEARALFQEALLIFERINDGRNIAGLWVNLARTAYRQGDKESARQYLDLSLSLSHGLEIRWTVSFALEIMGLLEREAGNYERATQLFMDSLHLSVKQANQQGIANCFGALAGMAVLRNQPAQAACLFAAAEKLRVEMGAKMGSADQEEYEHYLAILHDQLDPESFEAAWLKGSLMITEQIIEGLKESGVGSNCSQY